MSEQNEHTSEETEVGTNEEEHSDEQSKSEQCMLNNLTQRAMLEDEEMPTYISVSSPSRRDDSDISNVKQQERILPMEDDHSRSPYPSDDQGGGSVYVVSSGEDTDHPPYDEEDDYVDSEDIDDMDLENEREHAMLEEEEDEEDEEDEEEGPLRLNNENDDEIDGEFEPECFDRASDDFVLNNRLERHYKERSLSLQDLSICKNNAHNQHTKKRHSLNIFKQNYLGLQQNPVVYPVTHRKQSMPLRYRHVESKVKRYIKNIKEQNRRSIERRNKDHEYVTNKNHMETENNDTDEIKPLVTNKIIKDYAEKAIKDLQREENSETGNTVFNGETNKTSATLAETQYKQIQRDEAMDVYCDTIENEKNAQLNDVKFKKRNGSVDSTVHLQYQGSLDRNIKFNDLNQASLVNGHQPTLFNFRTLSYEEYLHGSSNPQKEDLNRQAHTIPEENDETETYNDAEIINVPEIENSDTSCPLKIENVKSIRMLPDEPENLHFVKLSQTDNRDAENIEITELKTQLNQKSAQFNNLRDAYQITLAENLKMKQEIDALKKSLAQYKTENKPCETKVAAVQTVTIVEPVLVQEGTMNVKETNKVSTSSVGSTLGSTDQWTDSACSPAISIKPPNLSTVLNSDDSMVLTDATPRKIGRPLSQTFITSSRILQTLSSITQGKAKPESPLVRNSKKRVNENSMDQLLNLDCNSPIQASSSKKRKATDMLGTPNFVQPFKIPHSSVESDKRGHDISTDSQFQSLENQNSKSQKQQTGDTSNLHDSMYTENKEDETDNLDDSVKCFVYEEEENSGNKSFLIQAEEPMKDILSIEKGRVRECGPYLLGNLEVRMSEINGTISVWGKEISQEDVTDTEEEIEASMKPSENTTCHCWQKTPHTRFNGSQIVCSTNKKAKVPLKFTGSNISQCSHSASPNGFKMPFFTEDVADKKLENNSFTPNVSVPYCANCDSTKHRKEWPTHSRISNSQEKIHSYCTNHVEYTDREYNCNLSHERQNRDDSPNCIKDKWNIRGFRRNSCTNTSSTKNHLNENLNNSTACVSGTSKQNTTCRSSPHNVIESCEQHPKCCKSVRNHSYMCKSSPTNMNNQENSDRHIHNHSNFNDGDEEPLLLSKRPPNETPETRQRRLRGKKVRGILMDLLRGCGDCRNTSVAGNSKSVLQGKEIPYLANGRPQIKISPCTPTDPSCSNQTQLCERCNHAYERRVESRIEELRMEMERVRSRSDAILDMLSMLYSTDRN